MRYSFQLSGKIIKNETALNACRRPRSAKIWKQLASALVMIIATLLSSNIAVSSSMAVAPLPDGRLVLFVVQQGKVLICWKQTAAPDSPWTDLVGFHPNPDGTITDVAVGRLPDGRLELFATTPNGLLTSWKQTPDPNSAWTPWVPFGHKM